MQNRRDFLKFSTAAPLLSSLGSIRANAANTNDYKALVCVFLFGGMDCHDTVLPYDLASYNSFSSVRASLMESYAAVAGGSTRDRSVLLPLQPSKADFGGREFALPPQMSAMHGLFEQGNAAIVGNVGPLLKPTDRAGFLGKSTPLPDRLFSHNDQQSTWMSFAPEGAQLGWGGLFGDVMAGSGANLSNIFSQISLGGNTVFLSGNTVGPYQVDVDGVPSIALLEQAGAGIPLSLANILRAHFTSIGSNRSSVLERDFINLSQVSFDANDALSQALDSASAFSTPFPVSQLGAQLAAVARTIAVRDTLGASRQIFFVAMGGFDTHSAQATTLPALQLDISDSMAAFYASTQELGVAQDVTSFTMADFGRTLTANGDGTDHGWGSHHFVVGGAVDGGDIYGDIPEAILGHAQDAGNGRLIPSISVEQLAASLGSWYGLTNQELLQALPSVQSFPDGAVPLFG